MVTLQDIADRVGVTRTVVSYALSGRLGKVRVSEARRTEILRVAAELGYVANRSARSLVTRRSRTLGLLLHGEPGESVNAGAYALLFNLLEGMRTGSDRSGYQSVYSMANLQKEGAFQLPPFLADRSVDAVALYGYVHPATAKEITTLGLPCLHIGTNLDPTVGIPNVSAGMDRAICEVAQKAADRGLSSAHLFLPSGPGPEGIAGTFLSTMAETRPAFRASVTLGRDVGTGYEEAWQHGLELARRPSPPALLLCSIGLYAPLLAGLKAGGLRCPEEIQLVVIASEGYQDNRLHDLGLRLSQVILPFTAIGEIIARQFIDHLEGIRPALEEMTIPCRLSAGETAPFLQP